MRNYPINSKQEGFIAAHSAIQMINEAFFDGFMTALLETPEELETMTVDERIMFCVLASEKNGYITRNDAMQLLGDMDEILRGGGIAA